MPIDYERLRADLMNYYGTAMYSASPIAMMDVIDVQHAGNQKLLRLAQEAGLDLREYTMY